MTRHIHIHNLTRLRFELGDLSKLELAGLLGIAISNLHAVERGQSVTAGQVLCKGLVDAFGLSEGDALALANDALDTKELARVIRQCAGALDARGNRGKTAGTAGGKR